MSAGLDFCLALHHAHAKLQGALDDELGLNHGIGFNDFASLDLLAQADGGRLGLGELAQALGQPASSVLRQLIVLEKIGLVQRDGVKGVRQAVLRPAGRALVQAARASAEHVCTEAVGSIAPALLQFVGSGHAQG